MARVEQVHGRGWIQEWYETGDPDLKARAKTLRGRGYRVHSESMGSQVTQWGRLKMTLLDIRPGTSGDEYLEQVNPRRRRKVSSRKTRNAGPRRKRRNISIRKAKKAARAEGTRFRKIPVLRAAARRAGRPLTGRLEMRNAPRVKGRRVKGGRAVSLRNFTGTIVRKSDGTVNILGRGRKR